MKRSFIPTAIVLAAVLLMASTLHEKTAALRLACTELEAKLAARPSDPGGSGQGTAGRPEDRRGRAAEAVNLPVLASRLVTAYARYYAGWKRGMLGGDANHAGEEDLVDAQTEVAALSGPELVALLGECKKSDALSPEAHEMLQFFVCNLLGQSDPETLLKLFRDDPAIGKGRMSSSIAAAAAGRMAEERSPEAAADWVRRLMEVPGMDKMLTSCLMSIARVDPAVAFSSMEALELSARPFTASSIGVVGSVAAAAKDPATQAKLLQQARDYVAGHEMVEKDRQAFIGLFLAPLGQWDFNALEGTLAALSPEEQQVVATNYQPGPYEGDPGPWLDWAGRQLTPEEMVAKTRATIGGWTGRDWPAAEAWLQQAPAGPVRDAGVESFVSSVGPYERETAGEMALMLPAGEQRDRVLRDFVRSWSEEDTAAAEEFMRKNGVVGE